MALASTLLLIIKIKQIIKKRILVGIALMSIAIITMLNVSAYGIEDLKIEDDPLVGGCSGYKHIGQYNCGASMWVWQRCEKDGSDDNCNVSTDQWDCSRWGL